MKTNKYITLCLAAVATFALASCQQLEENSQSLVNEAKLNKVVSAQAGKVDGGYEVSASASTKVGGYKPYVAVVAGVRKAEDEPVVEAVVTPSK